MYVSKAEWDLRSQGMQNRKILFQSISLRMLEQSLMPLYTCGAPILPEGHPVADIFIVRQDLSCSDPVEKQYYSCKKFDLICCRCGSTEPDAPVNEEMKRQYKVVNPVCRACSEMGAKPVVSGPKTVAASVGKKKRKKP